MHKYLKGETLGVLIIPADSTQKFQNAASQPDVQYYFNKLPYGFGQKYARSSRAPDPGLAPGSNPDGHFALALDGKNLYNVEGRGPDVR